MTYKMSLSRVNRVDLINCKPKKFSILSIQMVATDHDGNLNTYSMNNSFELTASKYANKSKMALI